MSSIVSDLREFICYNQKQTIKYEYLISERHKALKEYYNSNYNKKELKSMYDELVIESYNNLFEIFNENQMYINKIFRTLGKEKIPRVTIKTLHGDSVLNIYRSTKFTDFSLTSIEENTGFSEILKNDKLSFLDNNLPKSFMDGDYKNPRLIQEQRQKFKNGNISWKDCWKNITDDEEIEYYSSTLIIPMSIRSDEIDKRNMNFYSHFFEDIVQHKDSRTIWGFLCFDSIEAEYFTGENQSNFVNTGYIISDILSLYLMYFYNHISGSKTIKLIEQEIL